MIIILVMTMKMIDQINNWFLTASHDDDDDDDDNNNHNNNNNNNDISSDNNNKNDNKKINNNNNTNNYYYYCYYYYYDDFFFKHLPVHCTVCKGNSTPRQATTLCCLALLSCCKARGPIACLTLSAPAFCFPHEVCTHRSNMALLHGARTLLHSSQQCSRLQTRNGQTDLRGMSSVRTLVWTLWRV